jgi:hypothetical protein
LLPLRMPASISVADVVRDTFMGSG